MAALKQRHAELKAQVDGFGNVYTVQSAAIEKLTQQRDELLATLERLLPHLSGCWQNELREAIAKASVQ